MYKSLNPYKRAFLKLITSSFVNKNLPIATSFYNTKEKIRVLVIRPNHRLGNQLLLSPLLQEIEATYPNAEIDLLVNGRLSKILFKNYDSINHIHSLPQKPFKNLFTYLNVLFKAITKRYDVGISAVEYSNSGKIFLKLSKCKHKIYDSEENTLNKPKHIAQNPIYNFKNALDLKFPLTKSTYAKLDLKLSIKEITRGYDILTNYTSTDQPVIAIYTFATGDKMLSKKWWISCYNKLKSYFPDHQIIEILPKENVSQLDFKTTHYYSNNLRDIAAIIENCELFITADNGIMHLAASTNTTTFGLFKVTSTLAYEPYGNHSTSLSVDKNAITTLLHSIEQLPNFKIDENEKLKSLQNCENQIKLLKNRKLPSVILILFMTLVTFNTTLLAQNDSIAEVERSKSFLKKALIPSALIGSSLLITNTAFENNFQLNFGNAAHGNFSTRIDDYTRYVPLAQMYIADIFDVEARNHWFDQTKNAAISLTLTSLITSGLKSSIDKMRPNFSNQNALPSAHTASAFATATILFEEFKDTSPILAYSGYAFAATTGYLRIAKDAHWVSDILMGAGIGILITRLVYQLDYLFEWNPFKNSKNVFVVPSLINENLGVSFSLKF